MIYNAKNRKNFVTFHKKYAIFLNKITKSNMHANMPLGSLSVGIKAVKTIGTCPLLLENKIH